MLIPMYHKQGVACQTQEVHLRESLNLSVMIHYFFMIMGTSRHASSKMLDIHSVGNYKSSRQYHPQY